MHLIYLITHSCCSCLAFSRLCVAFEYVMVVVVSNLVCMISHLRGDGLLLLLLLRYRYEASLASRDLLDFDDLLWKTLQLFQQRPHIAQGRFFCVCLHACVFVAGRLTHGLAVICMPHVSLYVSLYAIMIESH